MRDTLKGCPIPVDFGPETAPILPLRVIQLGTIVTFVLSWVPMIINSELAGISVQLARLFCGLPICGFEGIVLTTYFFPSADVGSERYIPAFIGPVEKYCTPIVLDEVRWSAL